MKIRYGFLATALLLAACGGPPGKYDVREFVEDKLRDADSAEFSSESLYQRKDGRTVLCGLVNAKNGFGGMAGFTRFVAWAKTSEGGSMRGSAEFEPGALASDVERGAFEALRADLCQYESSAPPPP